MFKLNENNRFVMSRNPETSAKLWQKALVIS